MGEDLQRPNRGELDELSKTFRIGNKTTPSDEVTLADMAAADERALEPATGLLVIRTVNEVHRLRSLLARIYPHVHDTQGTEDLQAELEREVDAIRAERLG